MKIKNFNIFKIFKNLKKSQKKIGNLLDFLFSNFFDDFCFMERGKILLRSDCAYLERLKNELEKTGSYRPLF